MLAITRSKRETLAIRRIFKGEPAEYALLVERYQSMVYAVGLAQTGNIYYADKIVVAAFKEGFSRLVSLTDAKRLGTFLCALGQQAGDHLLRRRTADWNKARKRDVADIPVDLKWVQSELIDPLNEEMGPFSARERKGLLLHAFCGLTAKQIADVLKIDRREAEEDLARTTENVEKALLKEVVGALHPEVNNKERLLHIMTEVAGPQAASQAALRSTIGKPKSKPLPLVIGAISVLVLLIGGYFAYRVYRSATATGADVTQGDQVAADPGAESTAQDGEPGATEEPRPAFTNYSVEGRVVDSRFSEDGVAGVIVSAAGRQAETDFYGAFEISGVPRGQHDVTISAGGIVLQSRRLHTEERNNPIEIKVDENIPARFRIQGRVTDAATGRPITRFQRASCKDFPVMMQPYLLRIFTDQEHAEGILSDRFITLGDYTIYVRADGYAPLPRRFTIDENWDNSQIFDFPLLRAATLEGVVYGSNELSLAGMSILPRQGTVYGTATGYVQYATTDSMGRFSLDSLPIGVQSFLIHHFQHGTGRAIVDLEAGKTTAVRIQLPRRGALTGDITLNGRPTQFSEFRRRITGASVDLTKNVSFIAPGQYEIVLTPEPSLVWGSVSPRDGDRWFERRMEREVTIAMNEPTWLDFNFAAGHGVVQGNISLRDDAPRAAFVEVAYALSGIGEFDRFFYELGASGTFRLDKLPLGSGEITIYASPRATTQADFSSARVLMDRLSRPFELTESNQSAYLDFSL